jgi:hypothetical protein
MVSTKLYAALREYGHILGLSRLLGDDIYVHIATTYVSHTLDRAASAVQERHRSSDSASLKLTRLFR